jgi:peptide chain release factor 3
LSNLKDEIEKRRTFAIISHPDAGKTTLTEKLLLYGGAISLAGMVKGKKNSRHAVSDWMDIEKQRGISVTSSVMQFKYNGYCINILDTPGHQDFSEDTYRTLIAADSAVMVIDAAKGVEPQTKKLFKVCTMRNIPIFTFINKMDRDSRSPYDLLDQIEKELGIPTYAMNWPIGSGFEFKGVYDRQNSKILTFAATGGSHEVAESQIDINDKSLINLLGENLYSTLCDDVELLDGAGDELDMEKVRNGKLSPVFFGSALTNFGVEPFIDNFLKMTTPPLPRKTADGVIYPTDPDFSAFVFKIQANMNKAHRDRIAFMRICSGKFTKGMEVKLVQADRMIKLAQPQQMMAQSREIIDEAYPGDIIGIFDPGIFSIGDTVCAGKDVKFEGIPTFAPELFSLVRQKDTMKRKQFVKGTTQIAQEGAIQIFQEIASGMEEVIVGVVGSLQFDVFKYRMENEYNVQILMETLPYQFIRWIDNPDFDEEKLRTLDLSSDTKKVQDMNGRFLLLFANEWSIRWALEHNKDLILSEFSVK